MDVWKQLWFNIYLFVIFATLTDSCPLSCKCLPSCYCTGTSVDCRDKRISVVTSNFPKDTCTLELSINAIKVISNTSFIGIEKIQSLNIDFNGINLIENGAFDRLTGLRKLSLKVNMITIIDDKLFRGLYSLETLNLESNWISSINRNAFSDLISLVGLNLRGNKITVFTREMFVHNWSLSYLFIDKNPLHCNCTLDDFLNFTYGRKILIDDETVCRTPSQLTGVRLRNFNIPSCHPKLKGFTECEHSFIPIRITKFT
ncbi:slit homolog 2 protein-like isoform X2 [Saccostrea cucullata]|uniref:slit homolog 2 protein-like isoform X2 n=1 Tax=Saccostrea cuccullata TaxID=36930 RepID=UPI002ED0E8AD